MNQRVELDDLVYSYPTSDEPGIQTKLTAKYEFLECQSLPREPVPERGQFYNSQKFVHRFLLPYNKLFIIWRTGTGKTGAFAGKTEEIRRNLKLNQALDFIDAYKSRYRSNITRAIILVRGSVLKDEIINQILCKYSLPEDVGVGKKGNKLPPFYDIMTTYKFAKEMLQKTDQQILAEDDDTIYIIDEEHNLRIDPTEGFSGDSSEEVGDEDKQERRQAMVYRQIHRTNHLLRRSKFLLMTATPMINDSWEFMDGLNLLLPLNNQMRFSPLDYNLKTIEELEPYFRGKISYLRESGLDVVPTYDHPGMVKYDRTYSIKRIDGIHQYQSDLKIYPSYMELVHTDNETIDYPEPLYEIDASGERKIYLAQGNIYRKHAETIRNIKVEEVDPFSGRLTGTDLLSTEDSSVGKSKKQTFYFKEREICNAIYPDGSYGKEGFKKYIVKDESGAYSASPKLLEWIRCPPRPNVPERTPDGKYIPFEERFDMLKLRYLTIKYSQMVASVYNSYYSDSTVRGTSYAYTHWLKGSGAIYLGLCLDANGIEKLNISSSVFISQKSTQVGLSCPIKETVIGGRISNRQIRKDFVKKPRYALLHSGLLREKFQAIMELFNSWENRYGEYIKVIIYTPIGREGFNLSNAIEFYGIDPGWNKADDYQAESRGIRVVSHEDLLYELRQKYISEGRNPDEAKINVKLYPYAAIDRISGTSIDIKLFELSEKKDIYIKIKGREAKITAVDNIINRLRNQRPYDKDYTATCDYQQCKYGSYDPEPDYIDYSSYDLLYNTEALTDIIKEIKTIFRLRFSIRLNELLLHFAKIVEIDRSKIHYYRPKLINFAIDKMILDKIYLYNRYGFRSYLVEDNSILFIQSEFPVYSNTFGMSQYSSLYYSNHVISNLYQDLSIYITKLEDIDQSIIIKELYTEVLSPEELEIRFEGLTAGNKIKIIEDVIYKKLIEEVRSGPIDTIYNKYSKDIFLINEPLAEIQSMAHTIQNINAGGPGRNVVHISESKRLKTAVQIVPQNTNISPYQTPIHPPKTVGDEVIFHNLYGQMIESSYAATTNFKNAEGPIRLIKRRYGETWRGATVYETPVYHKIIQDEVIKVLAHYEEFPIYGFVLRSDGEFRIRSKLFEKDKSKVDARYVYRGRVCTTINKPILIKVAMELNIGIPIDIRNISVNDMRKYLMNINRKVEKLSESEIIYNYKIEQAKYTKNDLCDIIKNKLYELKRVFEQ